VGPTTKFFVWQLNSVFVFKSKHCISDTQIQHFENIFFMFSFLIFCTQVYCLIKKIFSLSLSHPTLLTAPISPSPNVARKRTELSLSLSRGGVLLVCGCRWWGFVEFFVGFCWFVVAGGRPFVDFVVGLVVGHDGVAGGCAFRWVWLLCLVVVVEVKVEVGVVAGDCRWPAVIVDSCS
jgi:hypothetical protein